MPTTKFTDDMLNDGVINIMDAMMTCKLAASKSEARRLITQGGVSVNDEKVTAIDFQITKEMLTEGIKIKKGKKTFHKAIFE